MPSHADIDPVDIAVFLRTIILVEIGHNPFRLHYGLVGTDTVIKCGVDLAGKIVGDVYLGIDEDSILAHYQHIAETRDIRFDDKPFVEPRGW
jgi:hypothetical protein